MPNPRTPSARLRNYPIRFAWKLLEMRPKLVDTRFRVCRAFCSHPDELENILKSMTYQHVWEEAKLFEVVHYLRGAKGLQIPVEYKRWLPTCLWDAFSSHTQCSNQLQHVPGSTYCESLQHQWFQRRLLKPGGGPFLIPFYGWSPPETPVARTSDTPIPFCDCFGMIWTFFDPFWSLLDILWPHDRKRPYTTGKDRIPPVKYQP